MGKIKLDNRDLELIDKKGFTVNDIIQQVNKIKKGISFPNLIRPANINDGIVRLPENYKKRLVTIYDNERNKMNIVKFIPASGAASRMFSKLFSYYKSDGKKDIDFVNKFIEGLKNGIFAFKSDLLFCMKRDGLDLEKAIENKDFLIVLEYVLFKKGLNYNELPKALIKFHKYETDERTPIDEHILEGVDYAAGKNNDLTLHFTISSEYRSKFTEYLKNMDFKKYNQPVNISISEQKESTQTIALDENGDLFRDDSGNILFRPGGHGALIENLNNIDADLIFIKNIDNVAIEVIARKGNYYKKLLAGYLLDLKNECFENIGELEKDKADISKVGLFIKEKLNITFSDDFENLSKNEQKSFLLNILNRPIRICGMVKNEGEPGGGPFFVEKNGEVSLQIIEKASIDSNNDEQRKIFENSNYFNPVDIVCYVKDYRGKKFDLKNYVDNNSFFVANKSSNGKNLKALELPGLWNGAMDNWITIFIEVPIITFNPVKTINDLLKTNHLDK